LNATRGILVPMRALLCLLIPWFLAAQEPEVIQGLALDLHTKLGADSAARIQLVTPGCWDGLLLSSTIVPQTPRTARRTAEATVEVWDLAPRESPRTRAFGLFLEALRERLAKALAAPPPKYQALELSEIMANDPSTPQKLDLTKVKSMQDRFNRLPPSGSPAK
jgi:hypothetical protein